MIVYLLCLPIWIVTTVMVAWEGVLSVRKWSQQPRLIHYRFWFFLKLGLLLCSLIPVFVWGNWIVGIGLAVLHYLITGKIGSDAYNKQVAIRADELIKEGLAPDKAWERAEVSIKLNVDGPNLGAS